MEEVKNTPTAKKPTIKQQYLQAAGQEIGLDYFLYTCFEEEKTNAGLVGKHFKIMSKKKYPPLRDGRKDLIAEDIDQALEDVFAWYLSEYPILASSEVLDYSVHSEMLTPYILLIADVKDLFRSKGQALVYKLSPESSPEQDEQWSKVLTKLQKYFPTYYKFMAAYISWITKAPNTAPIDLTSVPPVGRYLAMLQDARRRAERKANQGSFERGPRDRDRDDRGDRRDRKPQQGRFSSAEHRDQSAMKDVEQGIAKLKKNLLLKEILLKPQNSFVRREQHKRVKELGFNSHSSGEGPNRAVMITRAKKK